MRCSRKMVIQLCDMLGYRLVISEDLGNRKKPYNVYWVVDGFDRTVFPRTESLKDLYDSLANLLWPRVS